MHLVLIVTVFWIVIALAIWFFLKHKYDGVSSEIYIPFPLIALAIALWPISLVVGLVALIIGFAVVLVRGDN